MHDIVIAIPAYRPDQRMLSILAPLAEEFHCVVVDDGSGAEYAPLFESAQAMGASLLRHEENRGKGCALRSAFSHVNTHFPSALVITADADGQHSAKDIRAIAHKALSHPHSLILGVRDFSAMPFRSRFGNTVMRWAFRRATGVSVSDTQTGLRGIPPVLLPLALSTPGDRYEYEMRFLLSCARSHADIREMPIATIYYDRNKSSHFHGLRDSALILRLFFRK